MKRGFALYTGGKDSHYAIYKALEEDILVDLLVIVKPVRSDSWMFHTVNIDLAVKHAELMGLNYLLIEVSGVKEKEVDELKRKLSRVRELSDYEVVVSGAVGSTYQKERVDVLAEELHMRHVTPLWGFPPSKLIVEEASNLSFVITAIQAYGLRMDWLGNVINASNVHAFLKDVEEASINPVGEGGEFETFVLSSPLFKRGLLYVRKAEMVTYPNFGVGYYLIRDLGTSTSS
ncbi:MAG: hypothetical protein B7O98_01200 [Zestosphaera tikiterensis]|uniref:Diphthamide synthase domain-containing protein n=1 Tax=Zestosphaera tikiterensis TaxID=1973259 RepID=A0A2R7Y6R9_9CREN|nr:MAG: hypothetical protein B7O98_01200 [Zestosphaera tikiterensis]